jgi:hypothetical protein
MPHDLDSLPPALTADITAELYGTTPDHLYKLVREGRAPVAPIRLGRSIRFPRDLVLRSLGVEVDR